MSITLSPGQSVTLAGADTAALTCLSGDAVYSDANGDGRLALNKVTEVSESGDVTVNAISNCRICVTPSNEATWKEAATLLYPSDQIKTVVGEGEPPKAEPAIPPLHLPKKHAVKHAAKKPTRKAKK